MNTKKTPSATESVIAATRAHQRFSNEPLGDKLLSLMFRVTSVKLMHQLSRQVEPYGLSSNGYIALMMLSGSPDLQLNPSELSARIGETRGNMTRICDELVAKGLINRIPDPKDRRRVNLSLSEQGQSLIAEIIPVLTEHNQAIYQVFSTEEKQQMLNLMNRLGERLDELLD